MIGFCIVQYGMKKESEKGKLKDLQNNQDRRITNEKV